jgi:hypothetical protein
MALVGDELVVVARAEIRLAARQESARTSPVIWKNSRPFYCRRWDPLRLLDGIEKFVNFSEIAAAPTLLINDEDLARTEAGRTARIWNYLIAS